MQKGSIVEGVIETLAFGGQGIMRVEAQVVFVPFTAIGDVIRCRIDGLKKNFAEASLLEIIEPAKVRVDPKCPYYQTCGGCQLQHLSYASQLAYKKASVVDALFRIGKVSLKETPEIIPAKTIWEYRRHITLLLNPKEKGYAAGFTAVDHTTAVEVKECSIFDSAKSPFFAELSTVLSEFEGRADNPGRVTALKGTDGSYLFYFRFQSIPKGAKTALELAANRWPHWKGAMLTSPLNQITIGHFQTHIEIDLLKFLLTPAVFIQSHPEQSANIYGRIVHLAKEMSAQKILDLYCGIGISSLLLARHAQQVLGVEVNRQSIEMAKKNALDNKISNCHFVAADVKKTLKAQLSEFRPDLVVVNPPRGGLDIEIARLLSEKGPERILYISCMPPTLARDVGRLCDLAYEVESCEIFDMFPQTSHVETLIELKRKKISL